MEKAKYFARYAPDLFWDFRRAVKLCVPTTSMMVLMASALQFFVITTSKARDRANPSIVCGLAGKKIEYARHSQPQTVLVSMMLLRNLHSWNRKSD